MYADHNYYINLYGAIEEATYNRIAWLAAKELDRYTTGADGYAKLRNALPTGEGEEAVKRCECAVVNLLWKIERLTAHGDGVAGISGAATAGPVASVSSGSESISYAQGGTMINAAASDVSARNAIIGETVREYLSGVKDANGVNLLFMGVYPYVH